MADMEYSALADLLAGAGGTRAANGLAEHHRRLMAAGPGRFAQPQLAPRNAGLDAYTGRLREQEVLNAWRRSPGFGNGILDLLKPGWRDARDRTDPTIGGLLPLPGAPY